MPHRIDLASDCDPSSLAVVIDVVSIRHPAPIRGLQRQQQQQQQQCAEKQTPSFGKQAARLHNAD
jgi:hypothetical protein